MAKYKRAITIDLTKATPTKTDLALHISAKDLGSDIAFYSDSKLKKKLRHRADFLVEGVFWVIIPSLPAKAV